MRSVMPGAPRGGAPRFGPPLTCTYVGVNDSTSDASTYTFSSASIGAQQTGRHIVVAAYVEDSAAAITSVTLAGSAMTKAVLQSADKGGGSYIEAGIYILEYDNANTTADIVVNTTTAGRCAVGVWQLYNGTSKPVEVVSTSGETLTPTHGGVSSMTIDTIEHGAVIYALTTSTNNASTTTSPLTERYDDGVESSMQRHGSDNAAPTTGSVAYGCTSINTASYAVAAVAAFR